MLHLRSRFAMYCNTISLDVYDSAIIIYEVFSPIEEIEKI